jgi:hypothetical protein
MKTCIKQASAILATSILIIIASLLAFTYAHAADTIAATAPGAFDKFVQPFIEATVGILVSALCAYGVQFLRAKTGIAISDDTKGHIDQIATAAVMAVEERAAAAAKLGLTKWSSSDKLMNAINTITDKIPGITVPQAHNLVDATLAKIPGIGATGMLGVTSAIYAETAANSLQVPGTDVGPPQPNENLKDTVQAMASDAISGLLHGIAYSMTPTKPTIPNYTSEKVTS